MLVIFAAIFSAFSLILAYRYKSEEDSLLIIRLFGYYLLSITTISINHLYPIPIGFIIAYILADNTVQNRKSKKASTYLGLINYAICVTLYFTIVA